MGTKERVWGRKSPSRVQGQSPGEGLGGSEAGDTCWILDWTKYIKIQHSKNSILWKNFQLRRVDMHPCPPLATPLLKSKKYTSVLQKFLFQHLCQSYSKHASGSEVARSCPFPLVFVVYVGRYLLICPGRRQAWLHHCWNDQCLCRTDLRKISNCTSEEVESGKRPRAGEQGLVFGDGQFPTT